MTINYKYSNMLQSGSFGLSALSQDDIQMIHQGTLDVLWNIGLKVLSSEARQIFGDNGCVVDEANQIVKIPAHLVESAIQSTPATYRAHAIDPANDYVPGGKKTGFVNFGEAAQIMDPHTRKIRGATKADVDNTVRLMDKMDNIVGWERPVTPLDLDEDMASIYNAYAFFKGSSKHGFLGIYSVEHLEAAIEMGSVIAGGRDKLANAPLFTCSADPVSPLVLTGEATDVLIGACRFGVPIKINGLGLCGGTTSVSLACTLVTHCAEVLGSITLGQLVRKGAPMVFGSSTSVMDLKTTLASMGAPEMALLSAAVAKIGRFYSIPTWVGGG
jgi:trimethylamine---corrinoid protein Co-methyltransferase